MSQLEATTFEEHKGLWALAGSMVVISTLIAMKRGEGLRGGDSEHAEEAQVLLRDVLRLKKKATRRVCTKFGRERGTDGRLKCLRFKTHIADRGALKRFQFKNERLDQELKHVHRGAKSFFKKALREAR